LEKQRQFHKTFVPEGFSAGAQAGYAGIAGSFGLSIALKLSGFDPIRRHYGSNDPFKRALNFSAQPNFCPSTPALSVG
jgi:hypothetical protein